MTVGGYTYKVGDLFTTLKSKKTGVIKEIIPNASGSVRVLLEMPTKETRWTTVSNEAEGEEEVRPQRRARTCMRVSNRW